MYEIEHAFHCPYCLAPITMLLDPSVGEQTYVEDCEVCCSPIEVSYTVEEEQIVRFQAERADF
jgi:hypothetical protein